MRGRWEKQLLFKQILPANYTVVNRVSQKKWSQRSDNIRWIIVWASMSKYTLDTRSALVHCKHKVLWYHSPGIIASPSAKQRSIWESWWLRRRVRSNDNIGPGSGVDESALRTKCAKLIWKVFMKMSLCILCFFELFCENFAKFSSIWIMHYHWKILMHF